MYINIKHQTESGPCRTQANSMNLTQNWKVAYKLKPFSQITPSSVCSAIFPQSSPQQAKLQSSCSWFLQILWSLFAHLCLTAHTSLGRYKWQQWCNFFPLLAISTNIQVLLPQTYTHSETFWSACKHPWLVSVPVAVQQGFSVELFGRKKVSTSETWGQLNRGDADHSLPVLCGLNQDTVRRHVPWECSCHKLHFC